VVEEEEEEEEDEVVVVVVGGDGLEDLPILQGVGLGQHIGGSHSRACGPTRQDRQGPRVGGGCLNTNTTRMNGSSTDRRKYPDIRSWAGEKQLPCPNQQ